jgi:hypothetical protein
VVEVLGRYSNLRDQGERIRALLDIAPEGPATPLVRTAKQIQRRLKPLEIDTSVARAPEPRLKVSSRYRCHAVKREPEFHTAI